MIVNINNIPESVKPFLTQIAAVKEVEALVLFGSRAVGDHDARSDVDIAVVGRNISKLQWAKLVAESAKAHTLYRLSLTHFDSNPSKLQRRITETGVVIYVRPEA